MASFDIEVKLHFLVLTVANRKVEAEIQIGIWIRIYFLENWKEKV